jgi:hypothetical protein
MIGTISTRGGRRYPGLGGGSVTRLPLDGTTAPIVVGISTLLTWNAEALNLTTFNAEALTLASWNGQAATLSTWNGEDSAFSSWNAVPSTLITWNQE